MPKNKVKITLKLRQDILDKLKKIADRQGSTLDDLIEAYLESRLNYQERKLILDGLKVMDHPNLPSDLSENLDEYIYGRKK